MKNSKKSFSLTDLDFDQMDLFKQLSEVTRKAILSKVQGIRMPANTEIVEYMDQSKSVFFIMEGQIRVDMKAVSGRQITYQILSAGQIFGELAAIDNLPRSASVFSETDCLLAGLSGEQFSELVEQHPDFAVMIMNRLANLSRSLSAKVFEYHAYNVKGRICMELIRIAGESEENDLLKISNEDMALKVGTSVKNVIKIHKELKRKKIVRLRSEGIQILNLAKLELVLDDCEFD